MANNRIAYGLAKEAGIDTTNMTPKEVWQALKEKGIVNYDGDQDIDFKSIDELKKEAAQELPKPTYTTREPNEGALTKSSADGSMNTPKLNSSKRLSTERMLSEKYCARTTNPNYGSDKADYAGNCQRCVSAYEARRRGYDVTASPKPKNDTLCQGENWASVYEHGLRDVESIAQDTCANVKNEIENRMKSYGNGSRAIVAIIWNDFTEDCYGHVFVAEQISGKTMFLDPQDPADAGSDCSWYFNEILPQYTTFLRVDNREFTNEIENCID